MSYLPDDDAARRRRKPASTPAATRSELRAQRPSGLGRFFGLTTLGTVLPGSGLLLSGRHKSGGTLLGLFLLVIIGVVGFLAVFGISNGAVFIAVRPRLVLSLVIALAVGVALVVASVIATAWINRARPGGPGKSLLMTLFVGLLCALLVAPTVLAGRYALLSRNTLAKIFASGGLASRNSPRSAALSQPGALDTLGRITVLLLGTDAYPNRPGIRTDSMMVASIDTKTGDTVLFGIPRNLNGWQIRPGSPMVNAFPNGTRCGSECWLTNYWNAVESYATAHPQGFTGDPNPPLTELANVIDDFLGLTIDNTVIIDIRGFSHLVDAVGGVDITVRERLPIGGKLNSAGQIVPGSITGWIEPGRQHMNGYTAMWFARSRVTSDDFSRMRRQRCMLGALARQVNATTLLTKLPDILQVAENNISSDIDMGQLALWGELAGRVQQGHIRSLPFTHRIFDNSNPNYEWVHSYVQHALDPQASPLPATDGRGQPWPSATPTTPRPAPSGSPTRQPAPAPSTSTTPAEGIVDIEEAC